MDQTACMQWDQRRTKCWEWSLARRTVLVGTFRLRQWRGIINVRRKGRRHGVDWAGHVHPTFARCSFWDLCKSGEFFLTVLRWSRGHVCISTRQWRSVCSVRRIRRILLRPLGSLKQLQGASPLTEALPLDPAGLCPETSVIGSRWPYSVCVHLTCFDLVTHLDASERASYAWRRSVGGLGTCPPTFEVEKGVDAVCCVPDLFGG